MLNGTYTTIVGNAVADFDLRFTPGGAAVGDVTVAVNSREQVDGEWVDREDPLYVKVTLWWEYAENAAETIAKGDRVMAVGALYARNWETREGEIRTSIEMTADEFGPALRFAQAKITKVGRTDQRDDRDDDRRGGRGNSRDRDDRGRGSGGRGGSRQQRTNDRGSRSERRGSSARDDRDDRRGGGRSRRDDDRGARRGRSSQSVWDDDRDDDPDSDLPDEPNF